MEYFLTLFPFLPPLSSEHLWSHRNSWTKRPIESITFCQHLSQMANPIPFHPVIHWSTLGQSNCHHINLNGFHYWQIDPMIQSVFREIIPFSIIRLASNTITHVLCNVYEISITNNTINFIDLYVGCWKLCLV